MRARLRFLVIAFVTLFCGLVASGCDDVLIDPNFHTWCGDQLCAWKLESGQIRKAPTWHPKDFGVELLDSTSANRITAISQVSEKHPKCLEFATVADVAPEAQVSVGIDFEDDGTIDYEQPIAATGFSLQTTLVGPRYYTKLRVVITKRGLGRAVLAQMDLRTSDRCTAQPVAVKTEGLGGACSPIAGGVECSSGICCASGALPSVLGDPPAGVCSECCGDSPSRSCSDGRVCAARVTPVVNDNPFSTLVQNVPHQCDPGKHERPSLADCLLDDDCASGACDGAMWVIESVVDGGNCPVPPVGHELTCSVSSVRAGRCR